MDVLSEEQQVRLNEKKVRAPPPCAAGPPRPRAPLALPAAHICRSARRLRACAPPPARPPRAAPQVELRLENERYLRKHPELRQLFKHFMATVLEEKPPNVQEFAARFFTQDGLKEQVL